MQKILVTTDFSTASRAGLRFAIQLATQMDVELVFIHCFESLIPTTIYREQVETELRTQTAENLQKLKTMVADVHKLMHVSPGLHSFVVLEHGHPEKALLDYAQEHAFQYICMSTRGAGTFDKIIGNYTSYAVQRSAVPVIVVPHGYRSEPLEKLLYASDMENFNAEMALVSSFANTLGIKTDLAHFYLPERMSLDRENLQLMWRMKYPQLDQVYLELLNEDGDFSIQLDRLTSKIKPSLVVFFAHPRKTWLEKIFGESVSKSVMLTTKVPMLVYRKV